VPLTLQNIYHGQALGEMDSVSKSDVIGSSVIRRASKEAVAAALTEIEQCVPGSVLRENGACTARANRLTGIAPEPPDGVVQPRTSAEVATIVGIAGKYLVPLIGFGGGTSLEGHVNAPYGGLSVDFAKMNRISVPNTRDLSIRVEAGVSLQTLNRSLADTSVFFSVDPGAGEATLGGMASTRASGTNSVRYGTMRDNVLSLEVVMSDGRIIETATAAPKSAAGYDLTHLMVGSEGTLGLITQVRLKLHPRPQETAVAVAGFKTLDAACDTVIAAMGSGLSLARIELLDEMMLRAVNLHSATELDETPTLFVEFHGRSGEAKTALEAFKQLAEQHHVKTLAVATKSAQQDKLWQARHDAFYALGSAWPDATVLATDVCVPISRLAQAIAEAKKDIERLGLTAPIVGHVGDGNFHVLPAFDDTDQHQRRAVSELLCSLVATAHKFGGTCSGEHGIGQGKIEFLEQEAGPGIVVMQTLKRALDPLNILNPGKVVRL